MPSDLQRHEIGPGGEVLHLSSCGVGLPQAPSPSGVAGSSQSSSGATRRAAKSPWSALVYARGQRPETANKMLSSALHLPPGTLRSSSALHLPGVSVQSVTLPRGLPTRISQETSEALHRGLIQLHGLTMAVGVSTTPIAPALGIASSSAARRRAHGAGWRCEGHRYTAVVRNLDARQCDGGHVEVSMNRLCEDGFVNLFELSAFGCAEIRRYEIGAALWGGQWDLAARLLLAMNCGSHDSPAARASAAFRRGDLAGGIELLPESGTDGLRSLATQLLHKRPALQALQLAVPVPVWARHLSAVSKLAWNHAAAARIAGDLPRRPIPGDLVWDESAGEARPLVTSELDKWSLSDVVLPLPKRGEALPEFSTRLRMEATLRRLVPSPDAPAEVFPHEVKLPAVRRLICSPTELSWDIIHADAEPVVDCDLARLGINIPENTTEESTTVASRSRGGRKGRRSAAAASRGTSLAGLALRLRFSLPRSGSAESVLREALRRNPSSFREGLGRQDEVF